MKTSDQVPANINNILNIEFCNRIHPEGDTGALFAEFRLLTQN
jgi:hypothetical protein